MLIDVTDPHDPRLGDFVGLRDSQIRRDEGRFIAEGLKIIERSFAAGCRPRSLLLQPRWLPGLEPLLTDDVPVYVASEAMIERISGFHVHRGALGSFDRPAETPWDTVMSARRIIACEEMVDHANTGAVIRLAAGLGWGSVLVSPGGADPLYRRAVKASMGASLSHPWRRMSSAHDLLRLKESGFRLVATTLSDHAIDLAQYRAPDKLVVMVGTEGSGLSDDWLALADDRVTIPMAGDVDSLNVATAAAIFAYALR